MEDDTDTTDIAPYDEAHSRYIASLPLELRLTGLTLEQVLPYLDPVEVIACIKAGKVHRGVAVKVLSLLRREDILRAMSESDHVLALPEAALSALPASYLSTLPEETQRRIRERLGR